MAELVIDIPEGLSAEQKRDLQKYLTHLANHVVALYQADPSKDITRAIARTQEQFGLTA